MQQKTWCLGLFWLAAAVGGCIRPVVPATPDGGSAGPVDAGPCLGVSRRVDEFVMSGSNKMDVLLVVDDSAESAELLTVLPAKMAPLFAGLANPVSLGLQDSQPDFHLAVATTSMGGDLRQVGSGTGAGANIPCPTCRYLSRAQCGASGCENIFPSAVELLKLTPVPGNQHVGSVVDTLYAALGLVVHPSLVSPTVDPPAVNTGFYRADAGLAVFFITAARDTSLETPARYEEVLRTLRNIKGLGHEDDIVMVSLTSAEPAMLQTLMTNVMAACGGAVPSVLDESPSLFCDTLKRSMSTCGALASTFSSACTNGSLTDVATARAAAGAVNPLMNLAACRDQAHNFSVQADPRLLALTCDLDGVIYNACADDWTGLLLGRFTEFLRLEPVFRLQQEPSSTTSTRTGCPDARGSLCVEVSYPDGRVSLLDGLTVTHNEQGAAQLQVPDVQPGSRVKIHYDVANGGAQCCAQGCLAGEFCNAQGFCQVGTCEKLTACPDNALCDVVTQKCIPATTCTRNEHCPAGRICSCETGQCVPRR